MAGSYNGFSVPALTRSCLVVLLLLAVEFGVLLLLAFAELAFAVPAARKNVVVLFVVQDLRQFSVCMLRFSLWFSMHSNSKILQAEKIA